MAPMPWLLLRPLKPVAMRSIAASQGDDPPLRGRSSRGTMGWELAVGVRGIPVGEAALTHEWPTLAPGHPSTGSCGRPGCRRRCPGPGLEGQPTPQ